QPADALLSPLARVVFQAVKAAPFSRARLGLEAPGTLDGARLVLAIVVPLMETWTRLAGGSRPGCARRHTAAPRRRRPRGPGTARARGGGNRCSRGRARGVSPRS